MLWINLKKEFIKMKSVSSKQLNGIKAREKSNQIRKSVVLWQCHWELHTWKRNFYCSDWIGLSGSAWWTGNRTAWLKRRADSQADSVGEEIVHSKYCNKCILVPIEYIYRMHSASSIRIPRITARSGAIVLLSSNLWCSSFIG